MGMSNTEKVVITAKCQRFIDEVLKPRFLPAIRPTQFNYPTISSANGMGTDIGSSSDIDPGSRKPWAKNSTARSFAWIG